jgi:hypothetical protein
MSYNRHNKAIKQLAKSLGGNKMSKIEKASIIKTVQLALFREYGFQPCRKDIEILMNVDFPEFPGHVKNIRLEIKGHFYGIVLDEYGGASVQKY